ncbi:MAG: hypothetical protein KIS92_10835 [Planctomycetota bacterium]|nr:hypothetical protein [Planctomycetota bacterium]
MLGASGSVARAFLRRLGGRRPHFGRLVLLDKNRRVLSDPTLEHDRLDYRFIRQKLSLPGNQHEYQSILRKNRIDIVLDVTDTDTLPTLKATEDLGISYVNTCLSDKDLTVEELVQTLHPIRKLPTKAPHILCAGMNPGAVNMWVRHGIEHFGVPDEVIHFEYDTSRPRGKWEPLVTWSKKEFLTEAAWNPTGYAKGSQVVFRDSCAIMNQVPMRSIMEPVMPMKKYPHGMLILHEENLTLARKYNLNSRFIYAIDQRTIRFLQQQLRKRGYLNETDLALGDNLGLKLAGTDLIGACLEYDRKRVYYLNSISNEATIGTNATCAQVAIGISAAIYTLVYNRLKPRIYFVGDLYNSFYRHVLFCNMRVEEFVFAKLKGRLILKKHTPDLRVHSKPQLQPFVI